ncbi:hypothetical protein [Streptococcus suis]|uniref:hypothetical protein n=1 Tax=Streptococcus suis TaxID=1307 RepID=UPI002AAAFFBD|nr:hypothetical protein [Streptococcus suis]
MSRKNRHYFCGELVRYLGKSQIAIAVVGAGKNSTGRKRIRLPAPAQLIRPDLECGKRTNLPINHCAEMLTLTLSNKTKLFNHHTGTLVEHGYDTLQKDKDFLDAKASASAFLFCFVSLNALVSYYFISILRADLM